MTFNSLSALLFYNCVLYKKLILPLSALAETAVICRPSIPMVNSNRNKESHCVTESPEGVTLSGLFPAFLWYIILYDLFLIRFHCSSDRISTTKIIALASNYNCNVILLGQEILKGLDMLYGKIAENTTLNPGKLHNQMCTQLSNLLLNFLFH